MYEITKVKKRDFLDFVTLNVYMEFFLPAQKGFSPFLKYLYIPLNFGLQDDRISSDYWLHRLPVLMD